MRLKQWSTSVFLLFISFIHLQAQSVTISCPADVVVECSDPTNPSVTGMATFTTMTGSGSLISADVFAPLCGNSGTITRTWTATNNTTAETATCNQDITIEDTTAPVINCPSSLFVMGGDTSPASAGMATATDNCTPNLNVTFSDQTFGPFIIRTWSAMDDCGNLSTCEQIVVDEDALFNFSDPCSCRSDGAFDEVAGVEGPAGFDTYITSIVGDINNVMDASLPFLLNYDASAFNGNGGYITPVFQHANGAGYTLEYAIYVSGESAANGDTPIETGSGSNICAYPTVNFTPNSSIYTNTDPTFNLIPSSNPSLTNEQFTFSGNGVTGATFSPALANLGVNTVTMVYTADDDGNMGVSPDGGTTPAYPEITPGCLEVEKSYIINLEPCDADNGALINTPNP